MKKIKYLLKLMDKISEKTNKRKIVLFFDILYCHFKFKASYFDYDFFEMYNLNNFERNTIITKGINNDFIRKYNNPRYVKNFNNMIFKTAFDKYLKKEDTDFKQCAVLNTLCPNALNTILVVTLLGQVVVAFLQTEGNEMLIAPIDITTGIVTHPACDQNKKVYTNHPLTNIPFKGIKIPNWNRVMQICEQASLEVAAIGYASWEVCVEENQCYLINGNVRPKYIYYSLPAHRNANIGLLPVFKKAEERKIKE